jgi:hypothetical protein
MTDYPTEETIYTLVRAAEAAQEALKEAIRPSMKALGWEWVLDQYGHPSLSSYGLINHSDKNTLDWREDDGCTFDVKIIDLADPDGREARSEEERKILVARTTADREYRERQQYLDLKRKYGDS